MATLILSCSTGQGHNSCANAVKEYCDTLGEPSRVEDALAFTSKNLSRFICWGHVTIYRHFHGLFQIGYRYSEKHSGMFDETSGICRLLDLGAEKVCTFIRDGGYDRVVCTHVFASLLITLAKNRHGLQIPTCLVATDYTCNPGTRESEVDLHFIPDEPLSVYYECPNIADEQIISSGIPIRQMFYHSTKPIEAKLAFGIPAHHRHLLMMCGSMGCGPMKKLAKRFSRDLPSDVDLTIVCGTNKSLQKKLQRRYAKHDNIHIQGYVADMSMLMDSADLYLTKPGGISVTEAAMKNLPMVFIDAVAGCEEYNKIYFIGKKAAKTGATVREIADVCLDLLSKPRKLEKMRNNLKAMEKNNAAQIIWESMQSLTENRTDEKESCETCG